MEKETEHLLSGETRWEDDKLYDEHMTYHRPSSRVIQKVPWAALLISMLFFSFLLGAAVLFLRLYCGYEIIIQPRNYSHDIDLMLYSPLNYPLKYETVESTEGWSESLFFGEPSPESELAWNRMLHPTGMRLTPAEARHVGLNDNVTMPNGDIISVPAVMHNLHCLRRLRQTLQADHYQGNFSEGELAEDRYHTFHCLESIRHSLMCRADLTPLQFFWTDDGFHALKVRGSGSETCLNWPSFEAVRESRTYDRSELQKFHDHGYE